MGEPVEVIRILPINRWARNKVREHGEVFIVRRRIGMHRRSLQRKLDKMRIARDGCLL